MPQLGYSARFLADDNWSQIAADQLRGRYSNKSEAELLADAKLGGTNSTHLTLRIGSAF
jgi:hypothetical protein